MKKFLFLIFGILMMSGLVVAVDVAYVVNSVSVNSDFTDAMDELSLTYDVIFSSDVSSIDFNDYQMILLNNQDFPNPEEIPINEFPALMVNGRNMEDWGWVNPISKVKQSSPLHNEIINPNHPITQDIVTSDIQIYTSSNPELFYLGENNIYDGLEVIVSRVDNPFDAVIAVAEAGSVLTKPGYDPTIVNANSVFFGIHESQYWTEDTRNLFKNSLLWVLNAESSGEGSNFEISINEGQNLVSFPIELENSFAEILAENSEIVGVREFDNVLKSASSFESGKGYFIESSSDFILSVDGFGFVNSQSVFLEEGMNLVGVNSLGNIDLDDLPNGVLEVARRGNDGSYEISTKYSGDWENEFSLQPGKGYWMKTDREVNWNYVP